MTFNVKDCPKNIAAKIEALTGSNNKIIPASEDVTFFTPLKYSKWGAIPAKDPNKSR